MQKHSPLPSGWRLWLAIAAGTYVLILLCTRPDTYIDSFNYAKHIVDHKQGVLPPSLDPFFDFGHPLWRPMGYLVYVCFGNLLASGFGGNQIFAAAGALIAWSLLGGAIATIFLYLLLARLTSKAWVAGVGAMGFLSTHAIMNFSRTGTAYMAGAACQIVGLYAIHRAIRDDRFSTRNTIAVGILLGLSIGIWFPFVLSVPGLLCYALIWREDPAPLDWRARLRFALWICAGVAVVVIVVYTSVMAAHHISSVDGARQWMAASRYQISPTKGFARMLFSIPRSFFILGTGNTVWKRFLLRAPGDSVGVWEILGAGLWKLAGVYLVFGALVLTLRKSGWGRRLLICLAATALPLAIFAAFLFDPAPPERYMAIFPLLFAAIALTLAREPAGAFTRGLLMVFLGSMLAANGISMRRFGSDAQYAATMARLESVNRQATAKDLIFVPTFLDEAAKFIDARPFDPASRFRLCLTIGIPTGSSQVVAWQDNLAKAVFETWRGGGRVWISSRFLPPTPSPQWWIEGDESRVKWPDVPLFFHKLELVNPVGGADGFLELARSARNEELLRSARTPQ